MKTTFLPKPTRRTPQLAPLSPVPASASQRRTTHMAASLLLGYPSLRTPQIVAEVRRAVVGLPDPVAARFTAFCDYTETRDPADLEAEYVRTFDLKRKCSMYLTYFATGDTRKRGTALVRFVEATRRRDGRSPTTSSPTTCPPSSSSPRRRARTPPRRRRSPRVCSGRTARVSRCCGRRWRP